MSDWPALRVDDSSGTRDTLHLWSQILGKVKLAKAPFVNHWWHVTYGVTPRGFTTGPIPDCSRVFEATFDFVEHVLRIDVSSGETRTVRLEAKPISAFYAETLAALSELGIEVTISPMPVELETVVAFDEDHAPREYVREHARALWGQLLQADRVMRRFRGRFAGKVSPVHLFWGSFDLAVTRFSGRSAPVHPGGMPNCPDWVMVEGYSHELSSCGFWPGGGQEGAFYSYAYPEPAGYRDRAVRPGTAGYHPAAGQFLLPYEAVRTADDPDATLLAFFQDTYVAARDLAHWDASSDYDPGSASGDLAAQPRR